MKMQKRVMAFVLCIIMMFNLVQPVTTVYAEELTTDTMSGAEDTSTANGESALVIGNTTATIVTEQVDDPTNEPVDDPMTEPVDGSDEINSATPPDGYEIQYTSEMEAVPNNKMRATKSRMLTSDDTSVSEVSVLLIQESLPWSTTSNTILLSNLKSGGYIDSYTVTTMSAAKDVDFSAYMMIMIPSDQTTATYTIYQNEVADKINTYVSNGGILYFSGCDQGHAGGVLSCDMPGGVKRGHNYSNTNTIVDSSHPIVTGELTGGNILTNSMLSGSYCSHNYFITSSLPSQSHVVLQDNSGNPTLVEYPYGSGYVIASGLTWEFYYNRLNGGSGGFSTNSYDDVIVYAISQNTYDDNTWPVSNLKTEMVGSHTVELTWDAARNKNIIGYRVYRDGEQIADVTERAYTDTAPNAGETYTYKVIGYTASDLETEPAEITVTTSKPEITKIYTNHKKNTIGFSDSKIFAEVSASYLNGSTGIFYYQDKNGDRHQIGSNVEISTTDDTVVVEVDWDIEQFESGTYTVIFVLKDADGEEVEKSAEIIVDNSIPEKIVGVVALEDLKKIDLSWSISTEIDTTIYRVYRKAPNDNDFVLLKEISGRSNLSYTDISVEVGEEYKYYVVGVSAFGRESKPSDIVTASPQSDTEAPVIKTLSPAKNTILSGIKKISATAADNDSIAKMELYYKVAGVSEGILIASSESASVSGSLDTTQLPDGKIQLYALAWDLSGNVSNGTPVYTYTVDNTGPAQVTDLSYSSTATVITLSWNYVQDNDFDHFVVEELIDGVYKTVTKVNNTLGANITGLVPKSSHIYRVYAVDAVGNKGVISEEITANLQSDTTEPAVTAISPNAGYKNADFTVNFTLKDNDALQSVEIQVSRNRVSWTTVDTRTFDRYASVQSVRYTVNVSDYGDDGSLYIRAIPVDRSGNKGESSNSKAPYVEYILDRTAPAVPSNVKAISSGASICVKWDNDAAGETASYRVLRSTSEDGIYTQIASDIKAISYYDRTAKADTTYWYQVQAQDRVGNISEGSTPVNGIWTNIEDDEKPQILSVSPADKSKLGGNNTTISVLAQDNQVLSRVEIICKKTNNLLDVLLGEEQTLVLNGNGNYYLQSSAELDLSDYVTGDTMYISVVAYDANENASEAVECKYTVDTTAPSVDNLVVTKDGDTSNVNITWNSGKNSDDLNGYYIYRSKDNTWTKIGTRAKRNDGSYIFSDTLSIDGNYKYKIVAIDMIGNQSETISDNISYTKPLKERVVADFTTDVQQQAGVQYLFDATESYADKGIESYLFDFGDGTTSEQVQCIHIYAKVGTYTVTLTVTDVNGVSATSKQKIEVKERASLGNLTVTVVDDSGVPVANAPVYFNMGTNSQVIKNTNAKGTVTFTQAAGTYKVGAYMDGYLPVTKQVILSGGTTKTAELIMVEQPIVTGEFEVKRMTLEEIIAAGIDIYNPANQNCVHAVMKLTYGDQSVDIDYTYNGNGAIVSGSDTVIIGDHEFKVIPVSNNSIFFGGGTIGMPGGGNSTGTSNIVAVMERNISASCLKEFFDVKLHIMNQATEEFTLTNNEISLNVPDGLTVMSQGQSHMVETKSALKGQETWTLSWILRGDQAGEYELSADYTATLEEFNATVAATFKTDEPIKVYGMDAIKLIADINSNITYGGLYFDLSLKNVGGADLYLPSIDILGNVLSVYENLDREDGTEDEVSDKPVRVRNTAVTNSSGYTQYLGADGSVDTLAAGEKFTKQYVVYNAVTSTDLTYLRDAILMVTDDIGIEAEVNVVNKDLYGVNNADEKYDSIVNDASKKNMYSYLLNGTNFHYYQQALDDEDIKTYFGQKLYKVSDAVIHLDVAGFLEVIKGKNDDEKDIARQYIYELLEDESFQYAVDMSIDKKNLEITKKTVDTIKGMLASDQSKYMCGGAIWDDVNNMLSDSKNIRKLSAALQDGGLENFSDKLLTMLGSSIGAVGTGLIRYALEENGYLIRIYNGETLGVLNGLSDEVKTNLGQVSDALGTIDTVLTAWNTASEIHQQLIKITAAQEQALALTQFILDCKDIESTPTYEEVQKIHQGLIDGFASQQSQFTNELQKALFKEDFLKDAVMNDLIIGSIDKIFFENAAYGVGTVLKTLQIVYDAADYVFGWEDTANIYISLKTGAYLSLALEQSTDNLRNNHNSSSILFLTSLKYLIKMRIVGERMFITLVTDYEGFDSDYKSSTVLSAINNESGKKYSSLAEYYLEFKKKMLTYRDTLYDEVVSIEDQPAAPAVSIDYLNEQTNETFDSTYEYSFNNVDWTTCGNGNDMAAIKITPKRVGQTLYVRVKETAENRAGVTAVLAIPAMEYHRYATAAGQLRNICRIQGLTANRTYEVLPVNSAEPENPDWSKAVLATANESGELATTISENRSYLLYRYPATANSFASEAHSIAISRDLLVEISAIADGNGSILSDGKEFDSKVLYYGDELKLSVQYDSVTTNFDGWYNGAELYSSKENLTIEATESLTLTAKFSQLPQYTMTVQAGEGGIVSGGGTAYKGQKLTAKAFANTGYTFYGWKNADGKLVSVSSTRTVTMMEDISLIAVFEKLPTANIHISMSVQQIDGMEVPGVTVTVGDNVRGEVTPTNDFEIKDIQQNTPVTVAATDSKDATFVSWQTETGTVVSTDKTFTFEAEEYTHYIAVYKVQGQTVTFVSFCGDIQSSKQYTTSADVSSVTLADGITRVGYDFIGWKIGNTTYNTTTEEGKIILKEAILDEIKVGKDVILNAVYERQIERYMITVVNGTGGGTYDSNTAITVTANAPQTGMNFAGWYEDDTLLSTNRSYSFYVLSDRTLTAKYTKEEVREVGTTRIEAVNCNKGTKKISFVSMSSVPSNCKIEKAGVIATSDFEIGNDEKRFTVANAAFVRYSATSAKNYRYTWTKGKVADGQIWYVRAYLVYTDVNGNSYTIYGDVVAADLNGTID